MTLTRYLSRQLGARILAVLLGLLVLGLTLDLIENAAKVIELYRFAGLSRYVLLRAPLMLLELAPLGILAGAVLAFFALGARNELVVMRASGFSMLRLLLRLVPLALLLGVLLGQLSGWLAPVSERRLVSSFPGLFKSKSVAREFWLRDFTSVVRVGSAEPDGTRLSDISIFLLAPEGELTARIDARNAVFDASGWRLEDVVRQRAGEQPEALPGLVWDTRLTPPAILGNAYRPRLIDVREARQVLRGALPGGRGVPFYELQLWRAYAKVAVPAVMLVFAALAGFGLSRTGGRPALAALGFGGGAVFVLADGVFASLGEIGAMGAATAAFLAPAVFLAGGLWAIMVIEE